MKEYTLNVHWKQGDDLQSAIKRSSSSVEGLRHWGENLKESGEQLIVLADKIAQLEKDHNTTVDISGDTHMIWLQCENSQLLANIEKEPLVCVADIDDEQ